MTISREKCAAMVLCSALVLHCGGDSSPGDAAPSNPAGSSGTGGVPSGAGGAKAGAGGASGASASAGRGGAGVAGAHAAGSNTGGNGAAGEGASNAGADGSHGDGSGGEGTDGSGGGDGGSAAAGGGGSGGSATSGVCDALPPFAVYAREHLDSWGVNAGSNELNDVGVLADNLNEIGVRRIRTELEFNGIEQWQAVEAKLNDGHYAHPKLKINNLILAYNNAPGITWDSQQPHLLAAAATGLLTSIEGPNEMNNTYVGNGSHGVNDTADATADWAGPRGNVFAWADAIHAWKAGLAGDDAKHMANVEVLAPTIASGESSDYAMLPDLTDVVDYGNIHYYAGSGLQPSLSFGVDNPGVGYFANLYSWCRAGMTPTKPLVMTEYGATTTPGADYSEYGQAAYILNQLHEAAGIGAKRQYIYTLYDPGTGTAQGAEGNFGIFHSDASEKPAALALSNLKHLLSLNNNYDAAANAGDTACFAPGYDATSLTVSGIGGDGFASRVSDAVVYAKSDGSTLISVTNEAPVTDGAGNTVAPSVVTATVHFGSAQSWHRYDILGASPLDAVDAGSGDTVDVPLAGYPQYLILDPK